MEISLNGKKADITLESEKTVGDIIVGLESWLSGSEPRYSNGLRLSGLFLDGKAVTEDSIMDSFNIDISSIGSLDIIILSISELMAEAFEDCIASIEMLEGIDYAERPKFVDKWTESPASALLSELYSLEAAGSARWFADKRGWRISSPYRVLALKLSGTAPSYADDMPCEGRSRQAFRFYDLPRHLRFHARLDALCRGRRRSTHSHRL